MEDRQFDELPHVPVWRLNLIRFMFVLMDFVLGSVIWPPVLFGSSNWSALGAPRTVACASDVQAATFAVCRIPPVRRGEGSYAAGFQLF